MNYNLYTTQSDLATLESDLDAICGLKAAKFEESYVHSDIIAEDACRRVEWTLEDADELHYSLANETVTKADVDLMLSVAQANCDELVEVVAVEDDIPQHILNSTYAMESFVSRGIARIGKAISALIDKIIAMAKKIQQWVKGLFGGEKDLEKEVEKVDDKVPIEISEEEYTQLVAATKSVKKSAKKQEFDEYLKGLGADEVAKLAGGGAGALDKLNKKTQAYVVKRAKERAKELEEMQAKGKSGERKITKKELLDHAKTIKEGSSRLATLAAESEALKKSKKAVLEAYKVSSKGASAAHQSAKARSAANKKFSSRIRSFADKYENDSKGLVEDNSLTDKERRLTVAAINARRIEKHSGTKNPKNDDQSAKERAASIIRLRLNLIANEMAHTRNAVKRSSHIVNRIAKLHQAADATGRKVKVHGSKKDDSLHDSVSKARVVRRVMPKGKGGKKSGGGWRGMLNKLRGKKK